MTKTKSKLFISKTCHSPCLMGGGGGIMTAEGSELLFSCVGDFRDFDLERLSSPLVNEVDGRG